MTSSFSHRNKLIITGWGKRCIAALTARTDTLAYTSSLWDERQTASRALSENRAKRFINISQKAHRQALDDHSCCCRWHDAVAGSGVWNHSTETKTARRCTHYFVLLHSVDNDLECDFQYCRFRTGHCGRCFEAHGVWKGSGGSSLFVVIVGQGKARSSLFARFAGQQAQFCVHWRFPFPTNSFPASVDWTRPSKSWRESA
jgi:hypothetical protein